MLRNSRLALALVTTLFVSTSAYAQANSLLNASYDVSREFFSQYNQLFTQYKKQAGQTVKIEQSHGGSSKQAQAVAQGLAADVVTFNQVTDIEFLVKAKKIRPDWQKQFAQNSYPYYSTTAFLVRKGNPKKIQSWDDLIRDDVTVILANPKTSGNGRYSYLATWLYAHQKFAGDQTKIKAFMKKVLRNTKNFSTGSRGSSVAFANNQQGDVLLSFESELFTLINSPEYKTKGFQIIIPKQSILAQFPVAVVDQVVDKRGSRQLATEYLKYLYSPAAQNLLLKHNYRVFNAALMKQNQQKFKALTIIDPNKVLGSWTQIQQQHFAKGAILDQLLQGK